MITRRTVLKAATGTLSLAALGAFQAAEHSGATIVAVPRFKLRIASLDSMP